MHIPHSHVQLVESIRCVADLQGQALAQDLGSRLAFDSGTNGDCIAIIVNLRSPSNFGLKVGGSIIAAFGELHVLDVVRISLAFQVFSEHIFGAVDIQSIALGYLGVVDLDVSADLLFSSGRRLTRNHSGHISISLKSFGSVSGSGSLINVDGCSIDRRNLPSAAVSGASGLAGNRSLL